MELHCPNCGEAVEVAEGADETRCPKCAAPLISNVAASSEPKSDLLDDVLRDVRQVVRVESREAQAKPPEPEAPGVFKKPSRSKRVKQGPRFHYSAFIALGIALILGVGYVAVYAIQHGIAENRAEGIIARATSSLPVMRSSMDEAEKARVEKKYPTASRAYLAGLETARRIGDILENAPPNLSPGTTKDRLVEIQTEVLKAIRDAEAALEAPEIKFGNMGLVEYEGQWVTIEERDSMHADRMRAEGRQLYEGEWLTEAEIHERRGEVLFNGRWISHDLYAKLVAEGEAGPMMKPPTTPAVSAVPKTGTEGFEVSNPVWMLDDFEGESLDWTNVNWTNANPANVSVVSEQGSKRLLIETQQGNNDKCALVRRLPLDLSSRSQLRMDILNETGEPVRIAMAIETRRFYESRPNTVTMNMNKGVPFNLKVSDFKAAPHWTHMYSVANLNSARWLYILIYHNRPGKLYIDNIELLGSE